LFFLPVAGINFIGQNELPFSMHWIFATMDASSEQNGFTWRSSMDKSKSIFHRCGRLTEINLWSLNWLAAVVSGGKNGSELGSIIFYVFSRIRKYERND